MNKSARMVDLGECKVFLKTDGTGSPTVVIENALGGTADL